MRAATRARRPKRRSGAALAALALALASCRGFGPPPAEVLERFPAAAPGERFAQRSARVEIDSPELTGVFQAVAATRSGDDPAARLQLFGDVGGKVLDLAVTGRRLVGWFPHPRIGLAHEREDGPTPRHLVAFLAVSLLESETPLTRERIRGARRAGDGWELEVAPLWPDTGVVARTDGAGRVVARAFELRGARWTEELAPEQAFRGGPFALTLSDGGREPLDGPDAPPPEVFDLALPEGMRP